MKPYESEFTVFLREKRGQHPEWLEQQRVGRALLWDKKVNFDELRGFSQASVMPEACRYDLKRIG